MIIWSRKASEDLRRIEDVTASKSGYAAALDASTRIHAAADSLDKPMNGSRPGRVGFGEREKLVDLANKKAEFVIIFDEDKHGNIKIMNVKHHLEQYP